MSDKPKKMKRVIVYLEESTYNQLRAALILRDKTVSEWVRIIIKDFLFKLDIPAQKET